jgi:hypothetical protein
MHAGKPWELAGEADRIAVASASLLATLVAVGVQVRAAARELHDHGAQITPMAVIGEIDELPTDAVSIEVAGHRRRSLSTRAAPDGDTPILSACSVDHLIGDFWMS